MLVAKPIRPPEPDPSDRTVPSDHDPSSLGFEQVSRPTSSMSPLPSGGVPRALREAAEKAGIDPVAELFNEALVYAQEGHLRLAREHLQMLLCMAPDDGEARLLLAQVHVAGKRWREALSALDEARDAGVSVRRDLRQAVEEHLSFEASQREEAHKARQAREHGEMMSLRTDSRRVRGENSALIDRIAEAEAEARRWAWATVGVSLLAIGFVAASWWYAGQQEPIVTPPPPAVVIGGSEATPQPVVAVAPQVAAPAPAPGPTVVAPDPEVVDQGIVDPEPTAAVAEPVPAAAPPTPAVDPTVAIGERARQVITGSQEMAGAKVELLVAEGGKVTVTGTVQSYRQRKRMERMLGALPGVAEVDATATVALSRVNGTTHLVASGDTLSHIAYAYYGNSALTKPIARANNVTAAGLRPGMKLVVPPLP